MLFPAFGLNYYLVRPIDFKMKWIKAFLLTVFLAANVFAQLKSDLKIQIDSLLSVNYAGERSGASVLIAQNNQIVYLKAFGKANLEESIALTPQHIFRIGSVSKQFTAVAILKLAEEGKLSLQDPVTRYLPDYPTQGHRITLEHLLTHTSGIPSYTNSPLWTPEVRRKDFSPLELINFFKSDSLEFDPGTAWNYNNTGYFILGYIIEQVSGQSYASYLQDKIFTPLKLQNTLYANDTRILKNRAIGYQKQDSEFAHAEFLSMTQPYAAGSLMSTVEDLFVWHVALHAGKILHPYSLKAALTNFTLLNGEPSNYGYGFFFGNILGSPTIEHSGGINGYLSQTLFLPQENIYIAILTNCNCDPPGPVSAHLAATLIGKTYAPTALSLSEAQLKSYQGIYAKDQEERYIIFRNGKLYNQRPAGSENELIPYASDAFYPAGSFSRIIFQRDSQSKIYGYNFTDRRNTQPLLWKLTDKPLSDLKIVNIDSETLKMYQGEYQLHPGFSIVIVLKSDKLFAQATGQPAFELQALSQTLFNTLNVDAQIEFIAAENGSASSIILHQDGRKIHGQKVK